MNRFTDKVVLITGAGSGIGAATARLFAGEGASVVVADINADAAQNVAAEISARSYHLDIRDQARVRAVLAEVGRVDVLVNNAAGSTDTPLLEVGAKEWERDVEITLKGPVLCTQAVLPGMIENGGGVILTIGSVNGSTYLGNDLYSAAKAGLVSFTRGLAVQYGQYGVRANLIAPGTIRTPGWNRRIAQDPGVHERLTRWYPLGRIGEPEDVAKAALFLASDDAAWISGVVLPVDGGLLAGNKPMIDDILGATRQP